MATSNPKINISGLARRLVRDNLITDQQAEQTYQEALKKRTSYVTHLVEKKILGSEEIAVAASQEFGVPLLDLDAFDLENIPVKLVEEKLIRLHRALPLFKRGNRLFLGVSDPTNLQSLDEIKFHTGLTTESAYGGQMGKVIAFALEAAGAPVIKGGASQAVAAFKSLIEAHPGVAAVHATPGAARSERVRLLVATTKELTGELEGLLDDLADEIKGLTWNISEHSHADGDGG